MSLAYGYFPLPNYSGRVISQPTTKTTTTTTTTRTSNLPPPRPVSYTPPPTTTATLAPRIVTTTASDPTTGAPATGDQTVAGTPPPATTTTTQTSTGTQTGGTGTTDTSRLFDLIAASFKPQDIAQSYGPQSVSSDAMGNAGSGTNPIAIVILAIVAIAGTVWYMNRNRRAA